MSRYNGDSNYSKLILVKFKDLNDEFIEKKLHLDKASQIKPSIHTNFIDISRNLTPSQLPSKKFNYSFNKSAVLKLEYEKVLKAEKRLRSGEKKRIRLISDKIDENLKRFKRKKFFSNCGICEKFKRMPGSEQNKDEDKFIKDSQLRRPQSSNCPSQFQNKNQNMIAKERSTENQGKSLPQSRDHEKRNIRRKQTNNSFSFNRETKSSQLKREKNNLYLAVLTSNIITDEPFSLVKTKIRDWKTDNLDYSINDGKLMVKRKLDLNNRVSIPKLEKYPVVGLKDILLSQEKKLLRLQAKSNV